MTIQDAINQHAGCGAPIVPGDDDVNAVFEYWIDGQPAGAVPDDEIDVAEWGLQHNIAERLDEALGELREAWQSRADNDPEAM